MKPTFFKSRLNLFGWRKHPYRQDLNIYRAMASMKEQYGGLVSCQIGNTDGTIVEIKVERLE